MSDTIDRQVAIDALDTIESEVADGYGYQYEKWRKYFCELPSAQPEPKWIPYKRPDLSEEERIICKQYLEDLDRHRSCNEYKMLVGMLDAPTLGTWIPCGERLPEYNESVLTWDGYVFCIEKRIPYIRDDDGEPIEGDWWVSDEYDEYESEFYPNLRDGAAIAWMPLPEPYRGGDSE